MPQQFLDRAQVRPRVQHVGREAVPQRVRADVRIEAGLFEEFHIVVKGQWVHIQRNGVLLSIDEGRIPGAGHEVILLETYLVSEFAAPLPITVIAEMLGVDEPCTIELRDRRAWAPDGSALVCDGGTAWAIVSVSPTGEVLARYPMQGGYATPTYSPDGSRIYFWCYSWDGSVGICWIPSGGGAATKVVALDDLTVSGPWLFTVARNLHASWRRSRALEAERQAPAEAYPRTTAYLAAENEYAERVMAPTTSRSQMPGRHSGRGRWIARRGRPST